MISALDFPEKFLTTGCPNLDNFFNGGLNCCGITEFVGPAGIGKTQIALQLSITAQLPTAFGGLEAGTIFVCTEGMFPSPRLVGLCQSFKEKFGTVLPDNPMDNVLIISPSHTGTLLRCIQSDIPAILENHKIGLVILDSIAAPFRSEFSENEATAKTNELRILGRALHDIASRKNLMIICLNQVVGAFTGANPGGFAPSLGMALSNLVNNRIILSKKDEVRWMEVNFSCYIPFRRIPFSITSEGVYATNK